MKTELRPTASLVSQEAIVLEIWYNGHFIGTVVGADGPGVKVISKYDLTPVWEKPDGSIKVIQTRISIPN